MPEYQFGQESPEERGGRSVESGSKTPKERRSPQRRVADPAVKPATVRRSAKRREAAPSETPEPKSQRVEPVKPFVERRVATKSLLERRLVDPSAKERRKTDLANKKLAEEQEAQAAAAVVPEPRASQRATPKAARASAVEAELRAHERQNWLNETALWARKGGAVLIGLNLLTVIAVLVLWRVHSSQLTEMTEMRNATLNEMRRATAASGEAAYAACIGNQTVRNMLLQMKPNSAAARSLAASNPLPQPATASPDAAQVVFDVEKSTGVSVNMPVLFHLGLQNVGKSAALNAKVWGAVRVIDAGQEPDFKYDELSLDKASISPGEGEAKLVLYTTSEGGVAPLTDAQYQRVKSGAAYVVAYGRAYYKDVYGVRHWAEFCHAITPAGSRSGKCSGYNGSGITDAAEQRSPAMQSASVTVPEIACELPKEEKN
jgi:hypothetical protein